MVEAIVKFCYVVGISIIILVFVAAIGTLIDKISPKTNDGD